MTFSQLAVAIIDSLEFQRLRWIGQVGVTDHVYPTATHSRFEHCLGTAHLSKLFISEIARRQPELNVSEREIRCITLAGLCHDLGHGPFSHLWEKFYKTAGEQVYGNKDIQWHHEKTSVHIFRHLLRRNRILERFPNEINESDVYMIENLILGEVPNKTTRRFLYQIVNNPDSKMDVDKWDYFMRDAQNLGIKIDFEYQHVLRNLEVLEYEGSLHVCFRDKCYDIIQQAFENRFKLHKRAYQHHKVKIMDEMLIQALLELERGGKLDAWATTHAIACEQPTGPALMKFIELSDPAIKVELRKHSEIYRAMLERSTNIHMYRYIGKLSFGEQVKREFLASLPNYSLRPQDVSLLEINIHMGKEGDNPMNQILFFRKGSTRPELLASDSRQLSQERNYVVALRCSDADMQKRVENALRNFQNVFFHNVENAPRYIYLSMACYFLKSYNTVKIEPLLSAKFRLNSPI
ncbi:deoxynucleoside triphosphate triphosphohydrolase SAMHD1-like isoform X3 [Varroa jacobsoni]|nr:deoxynucleoside triphosphate triphosphohydrolase SAMHD1-like isoform X3 [Varroa jacobsoni]